MTSTFTDGTTVPPLSTWHYWWELIRCNPGTYALTTLLRIIIFTGVFQATGLATRFFFDSLTDSAPLGWEPWTWAALFVVIALVRNGLIMADMFVFFKWEFSTGAVLRKNMLERILDRPGARALPGSTGEAISRFRGDVEDVGNFTVWALFIVAQALFAVIAVYIMLHIDARITTLVFLPLTVVVVVATVTRSRVQKYREASRGATGQVTGFIGEMFDAPQAIKAGTAEEQVLARFHTLNEERRKTALSDRLFNELLGSIFRNTVNIGTGVILLLASQSLQDGSFTVGDFSLFVFYLGFMTDLTAQIGMFVPRFKQANVAFARMHELMQGAPPETLVKKTPAYLRGDLPEVPYIHKTSDHRLETLRGTALTYRYPDSTKGIFDIDLTLQRNTFTVITGRIGSGKTTLLRVLLGLLSKDSGAIYWNGQEVSDPASFFVPPRVSYTAQIPMLFSETLKSNILLGLPENRVDLAGSLHSAVLERDLLQLEDGLETTVGPRGVRLSGGQKQRSAAARMFARDAELLVFDDLSSALDVETEQTLWKRLFAQTHFTCLAVSHRRIALQQADQIIVMRDGYAVDQGKLDELLIRCEEMQHLWYSGSPEKVRVLSYRQRN